MFEGVMPVIHTPLDARGDVSWPGLERLIERMAGFDVAGFVVLGLASETKSLSTTLREQITAFVVDRVAGRGVVVAGLDGPADAAAIEGRHLESLGVDALMVRPPAGLPEAAVREHYRQLVQTLTTPILIQDSPNETGTTISVESLIALAAESPHLANVKIEHASGLPSIGVLVEHGITVVTGWGGLNLLDAYDRGARGCMPGCDLAPAFVGVMAALAAGDDELARRRYEDVLPLLSYETQSLHLLIAGAKHSLVHNGTFETDRMLDEGTALDEVQQRHLAVLFDNLHRRGVPGW